MDISTVYLLMFLATTLFIISLGCAITNRENVITVFCMFASGLIFWVLSNAYVSGSLTKLNPVTGAAEIIRDGITSDILMLVGLMCMAGFAIQIWQALSNSGVVEELGD